MCARSRQPSRPSTPNRKETVVATSTVRRQVTATKPSTPTSRRNWGIVLMLLIFSMLNFADKAAIGLASKPIRESMDLTASQYGLLSSAFFWLFAVGSVVLTAVFRKISYNWAVGLLMLTWIMTMLPLTTQTTFGVLLASRVALGFFEGPAHALCQSIVHSLFPAEKRAAAGAVVTAGTSLGPLIAAPVLTWIILRWDWHASFIFLIGVSLVWTVVWFFFADRLPFKKRVETNAEKEAVVDPNSDIVVPFYRLLMIPSFWGLALLSFAGYLITSLKVTWLPAFMNEGLGYSMKTVGTLVAVPYVSAMMILLGTGALSGWLLKRGFSSRVARSFLTAACLLFAGICMITFTQLPPGPAATGAGSCRLLHQLGGFCHRLCRSLGLPPRAPARRVLWLHRCRLLGGQHGCTLCTGPHRGKRGDTRRRLLQRIPHRGHHHLRLRCRRRPHAEPGTRQDPPVGAHGNLRNPQANRSPGPSRLAAEPIRGRITSDSGRRGRSAATAAFRPLLRSSGLTCRGPRHPSATGSSLPHALDSQFRSPGARLPAPAASSPASSQIISFS